MLQLVDQRGEPLSSVLLSVDAGAFESRETTTRLLRTDANGRGLVEKIAGPESLLTHMTLPHLPEAKIVGYSWMSSPDEGERPLLVIQVQLRGTLVVQGPPEEFLVMAVPVSMQGPRWEDAFLAFADDGRAALDLPPGTYQAAVASSSSFGFVEIRHPGDESPATVTVRTSSANVLEARGSLDRESATISVMDSESSLPLAGVSVLPAGPWMRQIVGTPQEERFKRFLGRETGPDGRVTVQYSVDARSQFVRSKQDILVEHDDYWPVMLTVERESDVALVKRDSGRDEHDALEICAGAGQEIRVYAGGAGARLLLRTITTSRDEDVRPITIEAPRGSMSELEILGPDGELLRRTLFCGAMARNVLSGCEDLRRSVAIVMEGLPGEVPDDVPTWVSVAADEYQDSWHERVPILGGRIGIADSVNRVCVRTGGEVEPGFVIGSASADLNPAADSIATLRFDEGRIDVAVFREGTSQIPMAPWVTLEGPQGEVLRGRCREDGTCSFAGLPMGEYFVQIEGFENVRSAGKRVVIDRQLPGIEVDLALPLERAMIRGIFLSKPPSAAAGAQFSLHFERDPHAGLHPPAQAIADSEGVFSFTDLSLGRYTIRFDGFGASSTRRDPRVGREVSIQVTSSTTVNVEFD